MFNPFKDYFYYTKNERSGTLGLFLISSFFFLLPTFYSFVFPARSTGYISYTDELPEVTTHFTADEKESPAVVVNLFKFDPNTVERADLLRLGLPENTAKAIINYRKRGGKFYQPTDLQRIYTLSEEDFRRIEDFIVIEPRRKREYNRIDTSGLDAPEEYVARSASLFAFNPNNTPANELRRLGLSKNVVNNILRYRAKGGKFYTAESLRKIYGLSQRDYERIAPYVQIEVHTPRNIDTANVNTAQQPTHYIRKNPRAIIDVNQATVEEWQQLRGIGKYYANQIVKFRKALGGFSSIEQIAETYNLRPETFTQIKPRLKLSPVLRRFNVNTEEMDILSTHPYLNWQQAQTIYNHRIQHGNYETLEDLLKTQLISTEELDKLRPYLVLNDE